MLQRPERGSDQHGGDIVAGSIAVFGTNLPDDVDDASLLHPAGVYGTHKVMVELAFTEAVRSGALAGMLLRLPGIVAQPGAGGGFGSAFLSDVFHAARDGRTCTLPVAADATSCLMSARTCTANLVTAACVIESVPDAVTLSALRVRMGDLIKSLSVHGDVRGSDPAEDLATRRLFGSYRAQQEDVSDAVRRNAVAAGPGGAGDDGGRGRDIAPLRSCDVEPDFSA